MGQPFLTIVNTGSKKLGNCYNAYYMTIQSRRQLSNAEVQGLNTLFNWGQEFYILGREDLDVGTTNETHTVRVESRVDSGD